MYAIGCMCSNCGMCIYVDTLKLWTNISLLFMFHNITTTGMDDEPTPGGTYVFHAYASKGCSGTPPNS